MFPLTPQTDGLEESDAGAEAEVEQVVLGAGGDGLALVAVVVHVEALAAENRMISMNPSVSAVWRSYLESLSHLVAQSPLMPPSLLLCSRSPRARISS